MTTPATSTKPSKRPPSPRKGIPLGARTTVPVGKDKNGKQIYSYMLLSVANYFGFPTTNQTPTRNNKFGEPIVIRGSKGGKTVRIPIVERKVVTVTPPKQGAGFAPLKSTAPKAKKTQKLTNRVLSIPMPAGMTIAKIAAFLSTAKKNKPKEFISESGRVHPVPQGKGGTKGK